MVIYLGDWVSGLNCRLGEGCDVVTGYRQMRLSVKAGSRYGEEFWFGFEGRGAAVMAWVRPWFGLKMIGDAEVLV
ncbi:hypothetical protein M0R45_001275 [Rubus argutus]|uniref:Uncharacterized protein n=1 Tax=Rubus argutus TaxID=59490 RepID=A0AAW1VML4_RUBAR